LRTITEIADNLTNINYKEIYKIISSKYQSKGVRDAVTGVSFSMDEIDSIKQHQYNQVKDNYTNAGIDTICLSDLVNQQKVTINDKLDNLVKRAKRSSNMVKDGFYNPINNIGTLNDPGQYNTAFTPVSMGPNEATSYYASRGLAASIIDKKSKVPLMNGFRFVDGLQPDDLDRLTNHARKLCFDKAIIAGIRDGLIYGGAAIVPEFKNDNHISYPMSIEDLLDNGVLDAKSISRFYTVDRWNMVTVPEYNITAEDYLNPKHFYIPLGARKLCSKRAAIIKPYPQPYWSAIYQLGWSNSDYEGWIKQYVGYQIIIASIPIMAQQMSLMFHEFPMDGIIAENGLESVAEFRNANDQQMRNWSMINPKTINSFGKISVIERTYTGFRELVETYREDLAANCAFPVSGLFGLQAKGMSADNEQDVTLKQSETIKMIESEVKTQLRPLIEIMVIDCFGRNSEQASLMKEVNIEFDSPVVISNTEKADTGVKFSQFVTGMVNAGMPLDIAIKQGRQFFPDYSIEDEDMERLIMPTETSILPDVFGNLNGGRGLMV
jgi:hypothetical protein